MHFDNFTTTDFKYDDSFIKCQFKKTQERHFWSQFYFFLFLGESLHFEKFKNDDSEYEKMSQDCDPKLPTQCVFSTKLFFFFLFVKCDNFF